MDNFDLSQEAKKSYLYTSNILYKLNVITKEQYNSHLKFSVISKQIKNLEFKYSRPKPLIKCFRPNHYILQRWEFHKGDVDPYPSIPHGHDIKNHKIKLDPYLGYICKDSKVIDRESRNNIILLWNDEKFRQFAIEAINHFILTNPNYKWRKRNPRKLPNKRRSKQNLFFDDTIQKDNINFNKMAQHNSINLSPSNSLSSSLRIYPAKKLFKLYKSINKYKKRQNKFI